MAQNTQLELILKCEIYNFWYKLLENMASVGFETTIC